MSMLKYVSLTTILVLLIMEASALTEPILKIRRDRFEMGIIPPHSTVTHSYWFVSLGTDTVTVDSIVTVCGCMEGRGGAISIPPHDSVKINFCWKVPDAIGARGGYPYVFTNTSERARRVYMTGTITRFPESMKPIAFAPYILDVSRFGEKSIDSLVFDVRNTSDEDLTMTKLSFDVEECEIILPEVVPAKSSAKGLIRVKPEYLDKEFRKSFTLMVSDERKTRLTVPVRRRIY